MIHSSHRDRKAKAIAEALGEPQHPQLGLVEVGDGHGGNFRHVEFFGGKRQSPTGDHTAGRIDDDKKDEAELSDARLQLADLRGRVFARLSAERLESFDADKIWIEIAGNGKAIPAQNGLRFHHRSPSNGPGANHFGPNIMVIIPADRTSRIYKVTYVEDARAAALTGRPDRRLRNLAWPNGRLELGRLETVS